MKKPLALMLGITGNMGFAAGCLLQALARHSPELGAQVLLYTDGLLPGKDLDLLAALGAEPLLYQPPGYAFSPEAIRQFSYLSLVRFEAFRLLEQYKSVIWLDVDSAIQGDISGLVEYGPLAMALEDPCFTEAGQTSKAAINVSEPVPGLDGDLPNLNSGVLVLRDDLPDPVGLYERCMGWMRDFGPRFKYIDQGVLNMLARELEQQGLFQYLPYEKFNAHPRNPLAWKAAFVHAFGAYKLWDDGLSLCSFPEWRRDYERWLAMGGSPWSGSVENAEFLEGGAFSMLSRFYENAGAAQGVIESLQAELEKEKLLRGRLEAMLERITGK